MTTAVLHDLDLTSEAYVSDPHTAYDRIREAGDAVYLSTHDAFGVGRYDAVRQVLGDWETFSSARGIALNDLTNEATAGMIIATDPPEHDALREVLADKLSPRALRALGESVNAQAGVLVDDLLGRTTDFDAVVDLAQAFPIQVVLDLVGLPADGRDEVLRWADAAFSAAAPMSERTMAAFPLLQEQLAYLSSIHRDDLVEGSMGRAIYDAADAGRIAQESCVPLMSAYVTAGVDTTINAISNAVQLFAEHPEQWDALRRDRSLLPNAVNEILRYDSPLQYFCRVATRDAEIGGDPVAAGSRIVVFYPSANRDERKWGNPLEFDIARPDAAEHLAFSYGIHGCAGQGLARLEAQAMLGALAERVERFEVGEPVRRLNQLIRGLAHLPTSVRLAD
ncbi:cytochrome P450 [Agromyces archimandritae]|uniref:Cytochrome P450 n=1 Tax=Agromyces archimandritae TaxID=2781962 RepID=A0A975FKV5_9MICO|nr:cytochrome P450 [Agromyces archimandritae]QTX04383.1 cytochrome P450 [Agromyces archimandritae]